MTKEYKRMIRKHKKDIMKKAKEASVNPFDWSFGLDMLISYLKFMHDYYSLGENVWSVENKEWDGKTEYTRLEMIDKILSAYNDWMNCEDKYFIHHSSGGKENGRGIIINGERTDWWIEYLIADREKNTEKFVEEYNSNRDNFFKLLSCYIEELWD